MIEATERFLNRVATLFPVVDEIWDLEYVEWRLAEIPVLPMGFDLWYVEWQEFKEPAPFLLYLMHARPADPAYGYLGRQYNELYPNYPLPQEQVPLKLVEVLRAMDPPAAALAGLPDLLLMLAKETDNFWLDVGECELAEGGYPPWAREEIAWLAEAWQAAGPVWDRVLALLNWQGATPAQVEEKLAAVHAWLLEAHERSKTDA